MTDFEALVSRDIKLERDLTSPSVPQARILSYFSPIERQPTRCNFCLDNEASSTVVTLEAFLSRGDLEKSTLVIKSLAIIWTIIQSHAFTQGAGLI